MAIQFSRAAVLSVLASTIILPSAAAAAAELLGPSPYSSAADSPFSGLSFDQFYLEDLQDGLLNTPGLVNSGGAGIFVGAPGSVSDSVEFTPNGGSVFNGSGEIGLSFTFDIGTLGSLPTHAGLVWTDGRGLITFEAFDQNGVSLGTVTGDHADAAQNGETGEDRFYGAINLGGISRITLRNVSGGIEADHIQYGIAAAAPIVPEPQSWAMMLAGLGLVGGAMRRTRTGLRTVTPTVA